MPSSAILEVPSQIALAISLASSATGADFDYLLATAHHESGFQASARAPTSSARGLFQFIEETWLRTIKEDGPRLGLGAYAERIFRTRNGRYYVPESRERARILALRNDPKIASMMAGAFARRNAEFLKEGIGRRPTAGELYLAHFLGAGDAVKMIRAAEKHPRRRAASLFPAAAKANRAIFYDGKRARPVRDVYRRLVARYGHRKRSRGNSRNTGWSTLVLRRQTAPRHRRVRRVAGRAVAPRRSGQAALWAAVVSPERGTDTVPAVRRFALRGSIGFDEIAQAGPVGALTFQ